MVKITDSIERKHPVRCLDSPALALCDACPTPETAFAKIQRRCGSLVPFLEKWKQNKSVLIVIGRTMYTRIMIRENSINHTKAQLYGTSLENSDE